MDYSHLLNFLWRAGHLTGREFSCVAGERAAVVVEGLQEEAPVGLRGGGQGLRGDVSGLRGGGQGIWHGAELVVDGERRRGTVVVGEEFGASADAGFEAGAGEVSAGASVILRVVSGYAPPVLGADDRLVPQINYEIEPYIIECYDTLRAGADDHGCAGRITGMSSLHRTSLLTGLLVERLQRKYGDMMRIFDGCGQDWNQTFHTVLLRVMGGDKNREAYTELAGKVTAAMVSREKSSPMRVEAMLLGAGGFLFAPDVSKGGWVGKDNYTLRLEEEARHLLAKYSIVPLKPAQWETAGLHLSNYPALRLAEIAALLSKKDFMLDGMLACRTAGDVERLFGVRASEYWDTHYKPGGEAGSAPKRIGKTKAALIGINLAAPLMFAYGRQTGSEELCERALELLAGIPAERNSRLTGWYGRGCGAENAFESQALLQLGNEYCARAGCAECPVGRGEIKKTLQCASYRINV